MRPLLSPTQITDLNKALYFMKMLDLKNTCVMLSLPIRGPKSELIQRIMTFVQTGEIIHSPEIPLVSRAKHHPAQSLHPDSLMLYGSYKNDLTTRTFFKKLIGNHFHFTAYGIDWLNERWLSGKPPMYKEFAQYWIEETVQREQTKVAPKPEWALINFVQKAIKNHPTISQRRLMHTWKALQHEQTQIVQKILQKFTDQKTLKTDQKL